MTVIKKPFFAFFFLVCAIPGPAFSMDAQTLIQGSVDYYRGNASEAVVAMTIHRPAWERTMTIQGWTRGQKDSVFTITAPPKDKGNGTLKKGTEMWSYNPKINRVIKLPPSMMSQAWMGSDFSNNDLAKSDTIIDDYTHEIAGVEEQGGKKIYTVKSIPKPEAPVVWGMQKLKIREDFIILSQEFFDEDRKLVKVMTGDDIVMMGGRLFPRLWKMRKAETTEEYTLLEYKELTFKEDLPDSLFTLTALRNVGR